jgi:outer membrane protein TolC
LVGGLSVSWDINGLYKNSNNKKLREIDLQKIANQQETFLFNTNLQLTQKQGELDRFKTLIEQDREILKLKTSIKKSYETKYDNGVTTLSQLLDRINDESMARQNLIVHEIQYLMTAYQYKNISGI